MRSHYPTDLSDNKWEMIRHFFNKRPRREGRPYTQSKREIVNAIFYVLRSGCAWDYYPMIFLADTQYITISETGRCEEYGKRSMLS